MASKAFETGEIVSGALVKPSVFRHFAAYIHDTQPVVHDMFRDFRYPRPDVGQQPGVLEVFQGQGVTQHQAVIAVLAYVVTEAPSLRSLPPGCPSSPE